MKQYALALVMNTLLVIMASTISVKTQGKSQIKESGEVWSGDSKCKQVFILIGKKSDKTVNKRHR